VALRGEEIGMATQNGTRRVTTTLIIGVMVSLSVTGLMVGQTLASQGADIAAVKARQDRQEVATSTLIAELKDALCREREGRGRDMQEMRAYLVEILKELKR
jgi:hypothetical protein